MTAKETIQNKVDAFFKSETELTFENLQQKLLEKGVEIRDAKTQKGRLQGFSYFDQKSGVAIPGSKLGSDYSLGLLARGLKYNQKEEHAEVKPDAKIPAMLKPLILPEQYGAKQIKPHASHQTEVILDPEKFKTQVVSLQIGPASKAMLIIGGLLAQASVFLIQKILAFLKRLLAAFGFGMRQSELQKYEHPDPKAPALCYEPAQLTLPAPKSAEDKAADELFRVAQALETNDSSMLPIIDGEEGVKARAEVVAAMDDVGGKGGGATTADAENFENFGFTDEDFVSTNAVAQPPKTDPMDDLKEALVAHEIAVKALKLAEIKDGPIHFTTVDQRQAELKIVREDLQAALEKWHEFCVQHPLKWRIPSAEKTRLLQNIENNEQAEKRALNSVAAAEAEDARIKKLYAALPAAIVPEAVKRTETRARREVEIARESVQTEALALINSSKNDPMLFTRVAGIEREIRASYKNFRETDQISAAYYSALKAQMDNLRMLERQRKAAEEAVNSETDGDADKPVVDGQTVK